MIIGICTNKTKDKNLNNTKNFISLLNKRKIECAVAVCLKEDFPNLKCYDEENIKPDILAVFGGDGTILRAAKAAVGFDIPILGINLGELGFLNEIGNHTAEQALDYIVRKQYDIKKRMLLTCGYQGKEHIAINDIVVKNGNTQISNVLKLEAYLDGVLIDKFTGDGIIISTPTGSTAYSLSAGGPVLSPDLNVLVITAICPHSLHSRPIVVSDEKKIKIKLMTEKADIFADGELLGKLETGRDLEVFKSKKVCRFISLNDENFYNKLLKKLNKWSGA